jgi:hypothetical protein
LVPNKSLITCSLLRGFKYFHVLSVWGGVVLSVSGVRVAQSKERVSLSGRDNKLSSGKLVDQLWCPSSPLFKVYQALFPRGYSFRDSGVSAYDVKNECSYSLLPRYNVPSFDAQEQCYLTLCTVHSSVLLFRKV